MANLTDQRFVAGDNGDGGTRRSILCVQPHTDLHATLEHALATYRVVIVPSAIEAIRAMNAAAFDAYIVDYWLADWTGAGLCRHIRKIDRHAPVLFFSSAELDLQHKRAVRAGATAFVCASDGSGALAAALRTALRDADANSYEARLEAESAMKDEVQRRGTLEIEPSAQAQARAAEALECAAHLRAQKAFLKSGGTIANFDSWWPQALESIRTKTTAGK